MKRLCWVPIALTLLAHVPGRHVYAANEALHGRPGWQFFVAGLLGDLLYVGPLMLLAFLAGGRRPRLGAAFAAIVTIAAWMFSVGAIESKLERGLYPTYFETKLSLASREFVLGQLPTLWFERYRLTSLVVLVLAGALLVFYTKRADGSNQAGFAIGGAGLLACAFLLVAANRTLFPRTGGYLETRSPLEIIALGAFPWDNHAAFTDGMRLVFMEHSWPPEDRARGLAVLGYPPESAARLDAFEHDAPCDGAHPLARPLDRTPGSSADAVLADLEGLALPPEPIVWQIAMESFRADDIHALNPHAPAAVTPVMNALYEDPRAIAFPHAFQGGFRTAQNLSALQCGVGSLPFDIAVARDLGNLPLRCLPDVLSDGGFGTHAFYASDLAYDGMLEFFRYHALATTQASDLPAGLAEGSWHGISDRALYTEVLAKASEKGAQYNFILTLSGHSPFAVPSDLPPDVAERAAAACRESPLARPDDCRRLAVIAYADYALGEFLEHLARSPLAARSVVVVSADHATSEIGLWPGSSEEIGRAHVPYVILLPPGVEAAEARAHAASTPISLDDSPSLVTAFLSSSLRAVPAAWRFHTYGGQATSPSFALSGARLWGTDSAAFVFSVDDAGAVTTIAPKNTTFSDVRELGTLNETLRGPAAVLASFVKGYLRRCEKSARLRAE